MNIKFVFDIIDGQVAGITKDIYDETEEQVTGEAKVEALTHLKKTLLEFIKEIN